MRTLVCLALVACSSGSTGPVAPAAGSGSALPAPDDAAVAVIVVDAASTTCAGPAPAPDYTCVQACGPPVVRQGDPPPSWHWMSPEDVQRRKQFGCPRWLPHRAVSELAIGAPIYTVDAAGARVEARVLHVGATWVTAAHEVAHVTLADGRSVTASPGHPDASGRAVGTLTVGDALGGSVVAAMERLPYAFDRTWDVLPSGPTGIYLVDGIPLRSTFFGR